MSYLWVWRNQRPRTVDALQHKRSFIRARMDPDFGLLDELLSNCILTREEVDEVKSETTFWKRNDKILDCITDGDLYQGLLLALSHAKQEHLVNYLNQNGNSAQTRELNYNWPLEDRESKTLDANQSMLVDCLELGDLPVQLHLKGVISSRQRDFISSRLTAYERNEALIDVLRRRSLRDYQATIECLLASHQHHIARILRDAGVAIRVPVVLTATETESSVSEIEEEIVKYLDALLKEESFQEKHLSIWELLQLKLLWATNGQNFDLYFICVKLDDLQELLDNLKNDSLKETLERVFNRLLAAEEASSIKVQLDWKESEFKRLKEFFPSPPGRLDSGKIDSAKAQNGKPEKKNRGKVKSRKTESQKTDSQIVESSVKSDQTESEDGESEKVESDKTNSEKTESEDAESEKVESEKTKSAKDESEKTKTELVQSEKPKSDKDEAGEDGESEDGESEDGESEEMEESEETESEAADSEKYVDGTDDSEIDENGTRSTHV